MAVSPEAGSTLTQGMLQHTRRQLAHQMHAFHGAGRQYIPRLPVALPHLPHLPLNQIPRWAKVTAGVAGSLWVGYSAMYFTRIQACESVFQKVEPRIPKAECINRKVERQLLKDLLADVPSGPICVQDYSSSTSAEFLLSVLSGRPASIVFDTQRWATMTTSEVAAELSKDLRVYHIFLKQKLQELLATFWNVRSDAGAMKDLTILLATATKALEGIKKIDPDQHHPPVIYVHGPCRLTQAAEGLRATANGTVLTGAGNPTQNKAGHASNWEQVFRNWCLEVANQRLAHVIFTSELDDLERPLPDSGGPVNVLTLSDMHADSAKELLQKKLLAIATGHSTTAPKLEKRSRTFSSSSSTTTVHGTVLKAPPRVSEGEQPADTAPVSSTTVVSENVAQPQAPASGQGAQNVEKPAPSREAKFRHVIDIAVDLLGGDATSSDELIDIAKTYARSYRMKSMLASPEHGGAPSSGTAAVGASSTDGSQTIAELDVWLLDSLRELVQRHWLRTVTALSDLYDPHGHATFQQALHKTPDSLSSIVRVSAHRIRLLYALRELSLHGSIPARKFLQTLLEGDEQLFQTLISRQIIRVKLADNALPLTRLTTNQEATGHLQVVCGSEVVRRALQIVLLLGNSPATASLHQLPAMHASLQKVADPAWIRQLAHEKEEMQANLGHAADAVNPDGMDSIFFGRKNTTNQQLKQFVQSQVQLTKKLGSWLSVSPTVSQWRDIVHNFPAQYGVVPMSMASTAPGARDPRTATTRVAAAIDKLAVFNDGLTVADVQQLLASVGKFYTAQYVEDALKYLRAGMFDNQAMLDGDDIVKYLADPDTFEERMSRTPLHWYTSRVDQASAAQTQHLLLTTAALCDSEASESSPAPARE